MMRRAIFGMAIAALVWTVASAKEVPTPRKESLDLPAVWKAVAPQKRLAAKRVAELDATRALMERIYGIQINANTTVLDLALGSDEIRGDLAQFMRGVRTTKVTYTDDLIVQVIREVTIREVIETITKTLRRTKKWYGVKEQELTRFERETQETDLAAMGNGAVPDSKGHRMIQAKRAAEMDAFRKLAETVTGMRLNSETRVRDLMLKSDEIAAHVASELKGAKTTDIVYRDDGSCDVTKQIVLRETIETIKRSYKRYVKDGSVSDKEFRKVETEVRDKVITVTGSGAPRAEGAETVGVTPSEKPFYEEVQVIRRVIKREVGVLK